MPKFKAHRIIRFDAGSINCRVDVPRSSLEVVDLAGDIATGVKALIDKFYTEFNRNPIVGNTTILVVPFDDGIALELIEDV